MKGPTPRRLWTYVTRCLGLQSYLRSPGDGRPQPQIPAKALLWSLLIGQVLRACSFLAVERLVRSSARRALVVSRPFSDDALSYFTERLDPRFTGGPGALTASGQAQQGFRNQRRHRPGRRWNYRRMVREFVLFALPSLPEYGPEDCRLSAPSGSGYRGGNWTIAPF